LKWKFIIVGVLLLALGSFLVLTFYLYRPPEPWTFSSNLSQNEEGEIDKVGVPFEGSAQYYFAISYVNVYSSHSVNITDPDGFNVTHHFERETSEQRIITGRQHLLQRIRVFTTFEGFNSTRAGTYTFSIMGYVGKPFVVFEVVKVEALEPPPSEGFVYAGCTLWMIGIVAFFISEGAIVVGILEFMLACVFFLVGSMTILSYAIISRAMIAAELTQFLQYKLVVGIIASVAFILGFAGGISAKLRRYFMLAFAGAFTIVLSSVINDWVSLSMQDLEFMLVNTVITVLSILNLALLIMSKKEFT
jgi:hypothetical protein